MSADVTVVATAAISAGAAVGGAWIGLLAGRQQIRAEDARQREQRAQARRDERKAAYGVAIDLITDWLWDNRYPPPDYDVLASFTHQAVRSRGQRRTNLRERRRLRRNQRFQSGLDDFNRLNEDPNGSEADAKKVWDEIFAALDELFDAARDDVGPAAEDFAKRVAATRG